MQPRSGALSTVGAESAFFEDGGRELAVLPACEAQRYAAVARTFVRRAGFSRVMCTVPARALGVGLGTLIALSGGIAQARDSRSGLLVGDPVVAMPADWQDPLSFVRTDSARNIFVASGHHVASFARNGKLIARWDVPDQVPPSNGLALDVSPTGEVFAAESGGRTVYRYSTDGHLIDAWTGSGREGQLEQVTGLAYDPEGSFVISDRGPRPGPVGQKRFSRGGEFLGLVPGATQRTTIGPRGRRWTASSESVWGYLSTGRPFQLLGDECTLGGGELKSCATGIGTFGASPPEDLSTGPDGQLATVGRTPAGADRVQLFRADGRVIFACDHPIGGGPVASIDFDGVTQLLLGARQQVYPATITSRAAPGCRRAPVQIDDVRLAKRWLSYRLSTRATVLLGVWDASRRHGLELRTRRGPGRAGTNRVTIRRCVRGSCLHHGRWFISLRATDHRQNRADFPALLSMRF